MKKKGEKRRLELAQYIDQIYNGIECLYINKKETRFFYCVEGKIREKFQIQSYVFTNNRFHVKLFVLYTGIERCYDFEYKRKHEWKQMLYKIHGLLCSDKQMRLIGKVAVAFADHVIGLV